MTKKEFLSANALLPHDIKETEKAMEQYANQEKEKEAIAFKEWNDSNLEGGRWEQYDTSDIWINIHTRQTISTKKLYELYKQQK